MKTTMAGVILMVGTPKCHTRSGNCGSGLYSPKWTRLSSLKARVRSTDQTLTISVHLGDMKCCIF